MPTTSKPSLDADEPLDPAIERVRAKLARLVLVAMGTLILGVGAVLAAVIYRATSDGSTELSSGEATIQLLPGAEIVSTDLSGDRVLLHIRLPDGTSEVVVVDGVTGQPGLRLRLVPRDGAGAPSTPRG